MGRSETPIHLRKHGIDFVGIEEVFQGETVTILDEGLDYDEELGLLKGRVVVIAHTESDEVIRIISVRKATKNEEIGYFKAIAD